MATMTQTLSVRGSTRATRKSDADPITTELVRHGLVAAAAEMKTTLKRTAISPIIYDGQDFACALFDSEIRLLAQAEAMPVFLGTMSFSVESAVRAVSGPTRLEPGDILFSSYVYDIGSHANDAAVVAPAFHDGKLIGYAVVKAHHVDVGAKEPYCTDTVDVFQEGTIFPGVKLYAAGRLQEDMWRTILANSRAPAAVEGDLNAEVATVRAGLAAFERLVAKFGFGDFTRSVEEMLNHGESTMRRFLAAIPDGRYVAHGQIDDNGLDPDPIPFDVTIEVNGTDVTIDLTDAPPQQRGPMNCPLPTTVSAARVAVMSLIGGAALTSEGCFRPLELLVRPQTIFYPLPPAPSFLFGWPAMQLIDVIHRALADALPAAVPAGSGGDLCALAFWGTDADGNFWTGFNDHLIGNGATGAGDGGAPLMHIACSGVRIVPAEAFEAQHHVLAEEYALAIDSAGAGRFRGGLGMTARYRMLSDCFVTTTFERTKSAPWGLQGGEPGSPNRLQILFPDGRTETSPKRTGVFLPSGTVLELTTGGGGGLGPPAERDAAAVSADIRDGYISEDAARRHYPQAFLEPS